MPVDEVETDGIVWRDYEGTHALLNERMRPVLAFVQDDDGTHAPFLREILRAMPANAELCALLDGRCIGLMLRAGELPSDLAAYGAGSNYHVAVLAPSGLTTMVAFEHMTGDPAKLVAEVTKVLAVLAPQWE